MEDEKKLSPDPGAKYCLKLSKEAQEEKDRTFAVFALSRAVYEGKWQNPFFKDTEEYYLENPNLDVPDHILSKSPRLLIRRYKLEDVYESTPPFKKKKQTKESQLKIDLESISPPKEPVSAQVEKKPKLKQAEASKKNRNKLAIVLAVILAISLVGNVIQAISGVALIDKVDRLETTLSASHEYNDSLKKEKEVLFDAYLFYRFNSAIVTRTGSKYHRFDCHYVEGREFYIYNTELAEAKGYEPCSYCWDRLAISLD